MGFFHLLVYFGGTPEHFVDGLEILQMFTKNCICSVGKCLLLLRPYLCLSEVLAWMHNVAQSPEVCSDLTCQQEGFTSQIEDR